MIEYKEKLKIWAAGLFYGEGSALIEKTSRDGVGHQIVVAAATTTPEIYYLT